MLLIVLSLVLVSIVELFVVVEVASSIGAIGTVFLLMALTLGGAWMVKREGLGVARRVRRQLDQGQLPASDLVDGLWLLGAGLLLLTPGFVTDAVGLAILVPFVRVPLRRWSLRWLSARLAPAGVGGPFGPRFSATTVTEATVTEATVTEATVVRDDAGRNPAQPRMVPPPLPGPVAEPERY